MPDTGPAHPPSHKQPRPARFTRLGFLRFSAVELLIAQVVLFVASPFVEGLPGGAIVEAILMTFVLVSAVLAVGGRRRMLLVMALFASPAVLAKWANHIRPDLVSPAAFFAFGLVFLTLIIVNLLRFVLRTPRVNTEVLCASISAYLMLGLAWSFAYRLVSYATPGAFSFNRIHEQAMDGYMSSYFSFVTLTTVGYGDIAPVSPVARMLAVMESMTGTLYVAVLIARLVALYSRTPASDDPNQPPA
ncbi:MAG: potassium channel family protein [Chthoniobacteraceae bacterium]